MKRIVILLMLAGLVIGGTTACSKGSLDAGVADLEARIAASAEGDFDATIAEAEAHWEQRHEEEHVREAIAAWERAITYDTGDRDRRETLAPVYAQLARGWYWLAHGHLHFMRDRRAREAAQQDAYQRGMEYGRTSLALSNPAWNEALTGGARIEDSVNLLNENDVEAAYWYATCAGRWATIEGLAALLGFKDQIFAILTRAYELDQTFFYRASDRYFGVYYTKVPFMNPDVNRSRDHFMAAINEFPQYLETRVLLAEELYTKTREREAAVQQLQTVLAYDLDGAPEIRAENIRAQARAQQILDSLDEFFR